MNEIRRTIVIVEIMNNLALGKYEEDEHYAYFFEIHSLLINASSYDDLHERFDGRIQLWERYVRRYHARSIVRDTLKKFACETLPSLGQDVSMKDLEEYARLGREHSPAGHLPSAVFEDFSELLPHCKSVRQVISVLPNRLIPPRRNMKLTEQQWADGIMGLRRRYIIDLVKKSFENLKGGQQP